MDQVSFIGRFEAAGDATTPVSLPPSESPLAERVGRAVNAQLKTLANDSRIIQTAKVNSTQQTVEYEYVQTTSNADAQQLTPYTYQLRDGMLYERFTFCEEWGKGLKSSFFLPIATLIRKVFAPLILSLPFIYPFLPAKLQKRVDLEMTANLPLRALAGFVGHLFLSVLCLATLGLASPYTNYWHGDLERWINGHSDHVDTMTSRERIKAMPYHMPCKQPIARFTGQATGEAIDIATTTCVAQNQKKVIAEHILALRATLAYKPSIEIDGTEANMSEIFPESSLCKAHGCS